MELSSSNREDDDVASPEVFAKMSLRCACFHGKEMKCDSWPSKSSVAG